MTVGKAFLMKNVKIRFSGFQRTSWSCMFLFFAGNVYSSYLANGVSHSGTYELFNVETLLFGYAGKNKEKVSLTEHSALLIN